jgi:transketolase
VTREWFVTAQVASIDELKVIAKQIRKDIINSTTAAGSGHPTSSMSAVELTVPLYFGGFLRHDPKNPKWPERDRFILSKGHAAPLLYSLLARSGYFDPAALMTLRKLGSPLEGHPNYRRLAGVEASTGSLGQGLSIGVGCALAAKLDRTQSRVFVLTGDGELGEGQIWEAAAAAHKYKLNNVIAMIDQNGYQQTGATADVLDLKPLVPRWQAFGWNAVEIDGHDLNAVIKALEEARASEDKPFAIIARTQKGYPITEIIHDKNHHGKPLTADEAKKAIAFIESR